MLDMLVTLKRSQEPTPRLKLLAPLNMEIIWVAEEVFQLFKGWLKEDAPSNR